MRFSTIALAASAASAVNAQRPSDTSICDYYTTALLKDNSAENQATLLTLVVNTVVIGNYTKPNVGLKVPGILAEGEVNGQKVNLLPYFNGELASTNRHGKPSCVNFLDGGAAEPLKHNKPANDDKSNQYFLITHLYQFFGALLGCSKQGMPGYAAYSGHASMYQVHKFMNLGPAELTYFISQVGAAAASFGVATDDIHAVATALTDAFDMRCAAPAAVIPAQGPQLQAICIRDDCPLAKTNATCDAYAKAEPPKKCSAASASMTPTGGYMPTGTGSGSAESMTAGESTAAKSTVSTLPPAAGAAVKASGLSLSLAALVAAAAL